MLGWIQIFDPGGGRALLKIDFADARTSADPFPVFAKLRERDSVHWSEPMKAWIITRYDDVKSIALNNSGISAGRDGRTHDEHGDASSGGIAWPVRCDIDVPRRLSGHGHADRESEAVPVFCLSLWGGIRMKQAILACIGMAFLGSTLPAQAAPPKQLLGRSVTVSWTETRSQRHVGETEFRSVNANHTLMVYVSSAGRVFSRQVNNITQVGSGQINQLGAARLGSYAVATPSFSGQAMTIVRVGQGGARRVAVAFDAGFSSCSATAGTGFEAGKTYTSYSPITKKNVEIRSSSVGSVSCSIRDGNVFGN